MSVSQSTVTREAGTSQPARRPVRRRLSASHLLIGVVVALAFSLNFLALQDRNEALMVAVADRPVTAGEALAPSDLRFIPVDADFEAVHTLIAEPGVSSYEGWVLRRSVGEGELVERANLIEPGAQPGLRSMSVPVSIEHAVGGTLSTGDRIDVISVDDGLAAYVVVDVEVLGVSEDDGSFGAAGDYHVVVAVDADQALALAAAIDSASLEVVRSTGAVPHDQGAGEDDS